MPILARLALTPGAAQPPTLSVQVTGADGALITDRTLPLERTRQAVLPGTGGQTADLARLLARMRSRSPGQRDVADVGRWLYGVLFGSADWRDAAKAEPGVGPVELLLEVADPPAQGSLPNVHDLHNLPW